MRTVPSSPKTTARWRRLVLIPILLLAWSPVPSGRAGQDITPADSSDAGLMTTLSPHDVPRTLDRFEAAARARGLQVFARIDHAAGAAQIGETLRPTALLIFGSAKIGTALLQSNQTMGIDLPLKVLVWEDAQARTWLGYIDPAELVRRHGIRNRDKVVARMQGALAGLVAEATADE